MVLDTELFTHSRDLALIAISLGIAVGVALSATIFWSKTGWQLTSRFFMSIIFSAVFIGIPFWYPHAAAFANTMISGFSAS